MKELLDEYMDEVSGGILVMDEGRNEYWLIAPVPLDKGAEFAKAFGTSDRVVTKEEYRRIFGRELQW